jgi:hypothetical protein
LEEDWFFLLALLVVLGVDVVEAEIFVLIEGSRTELDLQSCIFVG